MHNANYLLYLQFSLILDSCVYTLYTIVNQVHTGLGSNCYDLTEYNLTS